MAKHKCFVSYHKADQTAVDDFCDKFDGTFIRRGIAMTDDIIDSEDTDYVMSRIRELYLQDSTVTIVLIGKCTWARRFVDWEVQASLRQPRNGPPPNGLVAIQLYQSYKTLPDRVSLNVDSGYSKFYTYPASGGALNSIIEGAYNARTELVHLIENPRERYSYNKQCP